MKTAVGETLLIGMALSSRADPWPNSGSALGSFPGAVVEELGTEADNHRQNVRVHHTQNSSFRSHIAHGHFFAWVDDIRSRDD